MKKSLFYAVSMVLVAIFSSCNSDEGKEKTYQEPNIYVAGVYQNENGTRVATIWKNGVAQHLTDGTNDAEALSVFVFGNDVYVAGYDSGAKLWVNGVAQELLDGAIASSVYITNDGNVYVVGYKLILPATIGASPIAMLWVNGIPQELSGGISASSVCVSDTNIYVAGYGYAIDFFSNRWPEKVAKLWINGVEQELMGGSEASSVFVANGNTYAVGKKDPYPPVFGANANVARWWKNGVGQNLTDSVSLADAYSIYVSNNDVFITGHDGLVAKLWKNGTEQNLTDGTNRAVARSVYAFENDVYVAGYNGKFATFWKNGVAQNLTDGTTYSYACSIFVK